MGATPRPERAGTLAGIAQRAGVTCTLHQLRHSHATELVNGGVSLATLRKRLGHQHLQTTLRYAEVSDQTADTEVRRWRRQQSGLSSRRRGGKRTGSDVQDWDVVPVGQGACPWGGPLMPPPLVCALAERS
ncbi:site-specific integrase [Deinococcus apachensis]|uniref:site-specific integrase n=1 Tax=Deinococcus apachensis TaxID=309886 RepID=UPI001FE1D522|nr:site-specific integrase [Deinococcus apachensis]